MYFYEKRKISVELYIKYDLQVNPVIKELGYPTKMTLRSWIDEVSPVSTKRCDTNKYLIRYSTEEKKKSVLEFCERNTSAENIAKRHKVPRTTIYQWKTIT